MQHWRRRADGRSPVDAFEQHGELSAAQRDRSAACLRPDEASSFKPLRQQAKTVAVKPENLHDVPAPPTKDEDMARQRLLFEHRLHLGTQPMKAATHVRDARRDPDPRACRKLDQERRLSSTARTTAGSTLPSRLTRAPFGSSI